MTRSLADPAEVYHKITLPGRTSRYSAWFDGCGFLLDCERRDHLNRSYPCTAAEMAVLQRGGWSARQHVKFT